MMQRMVLPEGKGVERFSRWISNQRGVSYRIRERYPPVRVLRDLDAIASEYGFLPWREPYTRFGDREWECHEFPKEHVVSHYLTAEWADKDRKRLLVLSLMYNSQQGTSSSVPSTDTLEVRIHVRRFSVLPPPREM